MQICQINNLSMAYGTRRVLDKLVFSVQKGELLAVIGANGSGKTTLLRLLAGLEKPVGGEILFAGRKNMSVQEKAKFLAYLPQNYPADLPFSVEELVLLGRSPWQNYLGRASVQDLEFCRRSIEQVDMLELKDRPMHSLSGGEVQRAMLGRIFCQNAELFLLDEPSSALDYGQSMRILETLREHCKTKGKSAVVVLHDLNLAAMFADRLLALKSGKMLALGSAEQVCTPEILEMLYGCPFIVDINPKTARPRLSPYLAKKA